MGLLDQVLSGLAGGQSRGSSSNSAITDILSDLLSPGGRTTGGSGGGLGDLLGNSQSSGTASSSGGLGGLLEAFTRSGHGDIADSWVSSNQNRPIAPHQLEQTLGGDTIDALARRSGLSRDELLRQLSHQLPQAVDKLTPQGRRPSPEDMNHW